jgi:uncharacterized protein with FMN-binding domain
MKKILISGVLLSCFICYALYLQLKKDNNQRGGNNTLNTLIITPTPDAPLQVLSSGPAASPETMPAQKVSPGIYTDGTYTGIASDALYGTVQVKTTIVNGNISSIQFVQYPDAQQTSQQISQLSEPILIQEAIEVQSAKVDVVTGATLTSRAFMESLQSALNKADKG